jgi:molecular chaperone HscB
LINYYFCFGRAASRGLRPRSRRAIRSITFALRRKRLALRWFRYYPSRKRALWARLKLLYFLLLTGDAINRVSTIIAASCTCYQYTSYQHTNIPLNQMLPENYFELYDLPIAFYIDEAILRQRYLDISREYHPDGYTLADADTQRQVEEITTFNNAAYRTLSDFNARLAYILKIKGVLASSEAAAQQERVTDLDFLDDMMQLNEAVMELEFEKNAELYQNTHNSFIIKQNQAFQAVESLLTNYDDAAENTEILKKIHNFYKKVKYFLRISEKLSIFAPAYENKEI